MIGTMLRTGRQPRDQGAVPWTCAGHGGVRAKEVRLHRVLPEVTNILCVLPFEPRGSLERAGG